MGNKTMLSIQPTRAHQLREKVHSEVISDLENMIKHAENTPDTKIVGEIHSLLSSITTQRAENRGIPENENDKRLLKLATNAMTLPNTSCQANACEDPDVKCMVCLEPPSDMQKRNSE
eukprot:814904-Rhodomonas_salina.1